MNKVDIYEQRIHDIFPELSIENISLHDEGLNNYIIEVNNDLIFRFPKSEYAVEKLNKEVKILKLLKNYITLNIPKTFYEQREVLGYFMMSGVPLRKDLLMDIDKNTRQLVANQLATFLKQLHNVPADKIFEFDIPNSEVPNTYKDWVNLYHHLQEDVLPELPSHTQEWAKKHFEVFLDNKSNFAYEPKLIHGDLGAYHILFDKHKNCISGIIDFGTAGLGDPAMDIAVLIYNYGEDFLSELYQTYPELNSYSHRAKFYVEAFELQCVLSKAQGKDTTWFLCNLGNGKDIKYYD